MDNTNNQATVIGSIEDEFKESHEIYGEKFYTFTLNIPRLSGTSDSVRIMISERLIMDSSYNVGEKVEITGQFRSYNSYENGDNKLVLTVFAKDICRYDEDENKNPNALYLNGYICKPPVYRTTPFGREITDILLAVNRSYNKSDYIPIIAWGRNARFVRNLFERTWAKAAMRCQLGGERDVVLTKEDFELASADKEFAAKAVKKTKIGF